MIASSGLSRRFGSRTVVDGISFSLPTGSICALLGPNGAGKSTTLNMLSGLLRPNSGTVTLAGVTVRYEEDFSPLKQQIGVLPEGLGLFDQLTVEEHLQLCGPIYGLSREETQTRADQLVHLLGLEAGRTTYASHCSHGMRKKTALALALLHNPRILLLDEPFEGVEPVAAEVIRELFLMLSQRGVTILFTSHILSMAERLATHCILIRNGQIAWNSPKEELPSTLGEMYFSLVETPPLEDLPWLGSRSS
ncbi:ABC transporter ATP-binding protein [Geothrix sp. PMB-07]|uniref:ABC transporter ATP-binding protein n=1 Tax=Geothrix sp. PMB-07 TaxID=3068640 RepID=UPI0027409910|nr:ABC transporter ATP-binding protein [Geothrix sp. PMB-07]WLT31654.1 ABC transporter ATP-binding protein [Geothrix sp. PMB-07]